MNCVEPIFTLLPLVDEFRKPEFPDLYIVAGTIYNKFPFLQAAADDFPFP
jgi:hypothetical protein